jgi:hypothetical protein
VIATAVVEAFTSPTAPIGIVKNPLVIVIAPSFSSKSNVPAVEAS